MNFITTRFPKTTFCLIASTIVFLSTIARAEEFYVEIGRAGSEEEARIIWEDLRTKHKKILAAYELFLNPILQENGSFTYRVQAGPIAEKNLAQRVCNRLFKKKTSCFVIEGFDPKNSKSFVKEAGNNTINSFGFETFSLPWLQSSETQKEPAKLEKTNNSENINKAKVDVAEAIAVPVTENNEVTIDSVPEIVPIYSDGNFEKSGRTWLSVMPFLDETRLKHFWADLKNRTPDSTRELSMKAIRPLVSHDIPQIILAIGSFSSESAADEFCRLYIASFRELECRFSSNPPEGDEIISGKIATKNTRKDGNYENNSEDYSLFWVEVLSEKNHDKALEKWERIRTDNDDILSNVRSQITSSFANPGIYNIRIGPMKTRSKANKLCNSLKSRGVECKIATL